jgi:hypothetical protein
MVAMVIVIAQYWQIFEFLDMKAIAAFLNL